jgi:uncharacterized protein
MDRVEQHQHMKRLLANHPDWRRILRRRYYQTKLSTPAFRGYATLICLDAVREPLIVQTQSGPLRIVDAGYSWLQVFPEGERYTITTMYDADGQVVQWYIDICAQTGVSEAGIPWLDDLYLDIVVTPDRKVELLDADELEDALRSEEISPSAYDLAWREANRLMEQFSRREFELLTLSGPFRKILLQTEPIL